MARGSDSHLQSFWIVRGEMFGQILRGEVEFSIGANRLMLIHPDGLGLGLHADE